MELKLDGIAEGARELVEKSFRAVVEAVGEELVAGIVSGDACSDAFEKGRSVVTPTLVLSEINPGVLDRVAEAVNPFYKKRVSPPLLFTPEDVNNSLDAFPVEFNDLKLAARVVAGEFDLEGLKIGKSDLRLQCERELRGLQIHTRLAYLRLGGKEKELGLMMAAGTAKLLPILRGVVVLLGGSGEGDETAVLAELADRTECGKGILAELFALKHEKKPKFTKAQLLALKQVLNSLVETVDKLGGLTAV